MLNIIRWRLILSFCTSGRFSSESRWNNNKKNNQKYRFWYWSYIKNELQILNSEFFLLPSCFPTRFPHLLAQEIFNPLKILFGSAISICFFNWPKSNFPIKWIVEKIMLLWRNYTQAEIALLRLVHILLKQRPYAYFWKSISMEFCKNHREKFDTFSYILFYQTNQKKIFWKAFSRKVSKLRKQLFFKTHLDDCTGLLNFTRKHLDWRDLLDE